MGNASSIHQFSKQDACSLSTHFLKDPTYLNQLQPIYTTPNIFYPNSRSNSARKTASPHRVLTTLKKQRVIKIDSGNLNKAILLRMIGKPNTASQFDFDDCNVPVSTEGSQGVTKAHCTNQLLNKLDVERFDGNKTTTNSLDTSCLKHSPKATMFHPQAMYFNYDKNTDNEVVQLINEQSEITENISIDPPLRTKEDISMPPRHTTQSSCNSSRFPNKENNVQKNLIMLSNREKLHTRESPRQSLELTPQKQHQGEPALEEKSTRRLCLKSRSANRQKSQEIITESDSEKSYLPFKGDPLLRNYGMISEYTEPAKVDRLLNSDSKASPLPSGRLTSDKNLNSDSKISPYRLTHDKNEENDERSTGRRNSASKPVPKHRLLLQASKMKRERSCEALSSARRSIGTRDTAYNEPSSARPITNRTDIPMPVFSSPDKPELSIVSQQQQQNQYQYYEPYQQLQHQYHEPQQQYQQQKPEQHQQVESKWENFYTASTQMKKEMDEFKKDNTWTEEQKEVSQPKTHRQTIDFSHDVSPITKDNHITHFTHATLSLSHSNPQYTTKHNRTLSQDLVHNFGIPHDIARHNRTLSQDLVHNFGETIKEPIKDGHLSPQKPEENQFSPIKEEPKYSSPPKEERLETKEGLATNEADNIHGESFLNTQHFGTGTLDFQGLHLKDGMDSFDPPSSCYESNLTSQLEKERDIFVVDLLAKDNNSEYNRENYQSVLSDINQKIDGILRKCCVITERSNKSLLHPTPVSVSPNPTFIAGPGEMILDDPTLINISQAKEETVRNSPEKQEKLTSEEDLRHRQPNEIEDILGYSDAITKKHDIQGFVAMKDDLCAKQTIQPQIIEDVQQGDLILENENKSIEMEDKLEISREFEVNDDDIIQNYEQPKNALHNVAEENDEDTKEEVWPKDLIEGEEEQKFETYDKIRTEGSLVMIRKTLENEEDKKENLLHNQYATGKFDNIQENNQEKDTFTVESENGNDSMYVAQVTNKQDDEEKLQEDIIGEDKLENSFTQELASHRTRNEDIIDINTNRDRSKSPVEHMQKIEIICSPKRDSPQNFKNYDSPVNQRENLNLDYSKYPSVEIQRAAEELETLSKALNNLPQNPENFVSTVGLQSVKKIIMEKIECIHSDILERINNLNKKIETKSPLAKSPFINNRRDSSILSQEQTQDTRLDCSAETNAKRMMFSVKDGNRTPYSYSSQAKTESQPQSYCPSPFQSQPREQLQGFEPGLTFGQGNAEFKGYYERTALAKTRKGHQKERSSKFEPKQVSLSILNLVETSVDTSVCNTTNNRSMMNSRIDKADKHDQSIRQIASHNTASKPSSPLSYRSSLLKTATRDGVIKAIRKKSAEKDGELESMLSSTLRRDSSNEKDNKKSTKGQNSHRGILSSQQTRQDQGASEKEIREAFNSRQPNSPYYMSHLLGTDSISQKSRRGSYSEVKNINPTNHTDEIWVQEEIEKKKKLAVELMNLSSLRKSRELEMPEDCMRKMEEWARSETSSWGQIPTVRERKSSSQGILKLQDYLASEGKSGVRELNEYPLSTLLNKENQESTDTIFEEEFDSKRSTTRDQGVQTVTVAPENFYFKQRRESKENGRGISSLQNSMIEHSRNMSNITPAAAKGNRSQIIYDHMNTSAVAKTPERRSVNKNILLNDMEMFTKKRADGESEARSVSRIKKGDVYRTLEKQASASKIQKSGEKVRANKTSTEKTLSGLPRVSKSVRDNAVAISEMMQAYVLEQKERSYK